MATTKRRTPARKSPPTRRTTATAKSSRSAKSSRRSNPYVGPAIATGAVAAIAAIAASAWFFRNSGKSFSNAAEGLSGRIKDGLYDARVKTRESARSFKDKAAMFFADDPASHEDIAEEAKTPRRSGRKTSRLADETIEAEQKTDAISD